MTESSHRSRTRPSPPWAPAVARVATFVLAPAARLTTWWRARRGALGHLDGGSPYAPDPLTGDATSVEAADVAPV
jgi:hypothetical protein